MNERRLTYLTIAMAVFAMTAVAGERAGAETTRGEVIRCELPERSGSVRDHVIALKEVRFVNEPDSRRPLVVISYKCRSSALVKAYIQKVQHGTGVVLENRKIYEYCDPLPGTFSRRELAYRIGSDGEFASSGIYSIWLEATDRDGSHHSGFITYYWDDARGEVSLGTSGVQDSLRFSLEEDTPRLHYTPAEDSQGPMFYYNVPRGAGKSPVELTIFDERGRPVSTLVRDSDRRPGEYRVSWDGAGHRGSPLPAGEYYTRLRVGETVTTRTLSLTGNLGAGQ